MKMMASCATMLILCCGFTLGQAQYQVLYSFGPQGSNDAAYPNAGLVSDYEGNLYGTSPIGGPSAGGGENGCLSGCGTVFQLTPQQDGTWTETVLHDFCSTADIATCPDGAIPIAGLFRGRAGALYGTTQYGGVYGMGVVFELSPPSVQGGAWTETVLWSFCSAGGTCPDGMGPAARLTGDAAGNLFGTTVQGGPNGYGTVFELTHGSGSSWTETVLYSFMGSPNDGRDPYAGVTFDSAGNLYGTTKYGGETSAGCGDGCGVVFRLSPNTDGTWSETILFQGFVRQAFPEADLSRDKQGNLYGTTLGVPDESQGGVLKLNRARRWTPAGFTFNGADGAGPESGVLVEDGVLYGTTADGGSQSSGTVFSLTGESETVLYNFCSQPGCLDGADPGPGGPLLSDGAGHLYGTFVEGGTGGNGGVFEITP
jgi:uncharacterized repeat protein (TIGR03803 family)